MQAQAQQITLEYKIIKAREYGIEVYRLLVWREKKLAHLSTHMSVAGAKTAYAHFIRGEEIA